eukprot:3580988-Amphidinium_carterae.1
MCTVLEFLWTCIRAHKPLSVANRSLRSALQHVMARQLLRCLAHAVKHIRARAQSGAKTYKPSTAVRATDHTKS